MAKIEYRWDRGDFGRSLLVLTKAKGKLSIGEIEQYLLADYRLHGHYVILIKATESQMGGSGWGDEKEPVGDVVVLCQVEECSLCPICGVEAKPKDYCPHCGKELEEEKQ